MKMSGEVLKNARNWAGVLTHSFNPALGRQRQASLCEFEVSLVYVESSRPARASLCL